MNPKIIALCLALSACGIPTSPICDGKSHAWMPESQTRAKLVSSFRVPLYESCNDSSIYAGIGALGGAAGSLAMSAAMENDMELERLARSGIDYTVQMPDGETRTIRQRLGLKERRLEDGENVIVERMGQESRVRALNN